MKSVQDFNVKGKRVLVRCDFNVPLDEQGNILDDFRIEKTIPTIEYLVSKGAKVILMSHLGKPEGKVKKEYSLSCIQDKLVEYLDISVAKAKDCVGKDIEKWTQEMREGEILLLENLRFHKEEEENDSDFAKKLARLADIYVNDAFSVSHRRHASLVGVPKFLPSCIGLLFREELKAMEKILKEPKRPLVGIVGGAKVESKIKPINEFLKIVDFLLIGGKIANTIFMVKRTSGNKSFVEQEAMREIETFELTNPKLRMPVDAVFGEDKLVLDIGPETIKIFSQIIKEAKTIFWSGPLGKIEEEKFNKGTLEIAKTIAKSKAYSVAGGSETVSFLRKCNLGQGFSHLSTAGGAMLEYLSQGTLPAIEALVE